MSQHIGPRTISAIGGSIKRVGPYRIHTFPSELVTDGLVLNLDAGDPRSLDPANTGLTTWTDLSGNGNNGTLVNGTSYSNVDGGSLVFASTNTNLVKLNSSFVGNLNEFTIDIWVKRSAVSDRYVYVETTNTGSNPFWGITSSNDAGYYGYLRVYARNDNGTQELDWEPRDSVFNIYDNTWHNIVFVFSDNLIKFYVDGSLAGTQTWTKGSFNNLEHSTLGAIEYNGGNQNAAIDGNISNVKRYNRALSPAEVAQNYDALRVRYESYTSTFTPICAGGEGKVEVLCVAGGGGGGADHGGGGGGAGGLIYNSAFSINSNTGIGVTIGSGGGQQTNGGNTTFSSLTSIGGGRGGGENAPVDGQSGGSGGGGSGRPIATTGGSGTSGQGFDGGRGGYPDTSNTLYGCGGGGGGAGGLGTDGKEGVNIGFGAAGNGGPGLSYSISGESKFYAGGGGGGYWGSAFAGGLGGSGVGGKGGEGQGNPGGYTGRNGIPNTGSGGGGSSGSGFPRNGGNGANGTVIVRYPATDYNVEVLVVGGGGGGGYCKVADGGGGGGGAGGLIYNSAFPVSSGKKLQVTIGSGGAGSTTIDGTVNGSNGSNSIFSSLIAIGGGGGGSTRDSRVLSVGGSGGGAGSDLGDNTGGFGTIGQGNNGGSNSTGNTGAGGGGAGEVGVSASDGTEVPDGGDGLAYSVTGTSTYYAGGGGGGKYNNGTNAAGSGGLGGGGAGGKGAVGSNGTVNTGGGGGGGGMESGVTGSAGGNGGSGIVIIAYKGPQRGIGGVVDTTSRPGYTLHKFTAVGTDFFIP